MKYLFMVIKKQKNILNKININEFARFQLIKWNMKTVFGLFSPSLFHIELNAFLSTYLEFNFIHR